VSGEAPTFPNAYTIGICHKKHQSFFIKKEHKDETEKYIAGIIAIPTIYIF
jgi:hypothetical protein